MADGGKETQTSSPVPTHDKGGVNIDGQLRQAEVFKGLDYYNPNPWVRVLERANEFEIEIDGVISKALIDSGAMISMIRSIAMNMSMRLNP